MGSWEITPHGRNKGAEAWRGQKEGSWDQEEADRWASGAPAGHSEFYPERNGKPWAGRKDLEKTGARRTGAGVRRPLE